MRGEDFDLTPGTATAAVLAGLADRSRWAALADAIVAAEGGDGAKLSAFLEPLLVGRDEDPPRIDAGLITGCNDTTSRVPPERVTGLTDRLAGQAPVVRRLLRPQTAGLRPVPGAAAGEGAEAGGRAADPGADHRDRPGDAAEGSERAAQALPAGVVIGWQGGGHGALGQSACATRAAEEFLVDAKVPSSGTVCPP